MQGEGFHLFLQSLGSNWTIALIAVISVALWWLVGLTGVSVGRWVAAGFRRANP